ncbi:DUF3455 domain-containing protein [Paraburkholderia jirisanensis]
MYRFSAPRFSSRVAMLRAALAAGAAASFSSFALCATPLPAAPPAALVPPDAQPVMSLTATGVQIYNCEYDSAHRLGWVFKSPKATLYDEHGHVAVQHDAGPTWQAEDGSKIAGHMLAQAASASPGSIAQLLLSASSTGSQGQLSGIRYVQRLNTVGGAAPAAPCTTEHEPGYSPYYANYVFLK